MQIGETLRKLRIDKGLTQNQVQKKAKITQTYLSQVENNIKEPSAEMLRKLCEYYGVPHQVVIWNSLEEKDIPKNKLRAFKRLKPFIDDFLSTL